MREFVTSSDIVSIEQELVKLDPRLLGDPAMLAAMACRLDETDPQENVARIRIANYVAFRWPKLGSSLKHSLQKGELTGALLQDVLKRKAKRN